MSNSLTIMIILAYHSMMHTEINISNQRLQSHNHPMVYAHNQRFNHNMRTICYAVIS